MNIPKYWAKESRDCKWPDGRDLPLTCWRWSQRSLEEARRLASEAVEEIARKLGRGQQMGRYAYGERPMREEITEVLTNISGEEIAVITRNGYGALVLNAARVMFMDIDFEKEPLMDSLKRSIGRLFGKKAPDVEDEYVRKIEQWAESHRDLSLRAYRTFAGLRCVVVNKVFDPASDSAMGLLKSFQCDPLYVRLCRNQACFRARLTPKHWRCGMEKPPLRWPWDNSKDEAKYREWQGRYERAASKYAVCRLVKQIGGEAAHPDARAIVSLHDKMCCSAGDVRLA